MLNDHLKHYYNRLTPIDILVSAYCAVMLFLVSLRIREGGWTAAALMLNFSAVLVFAAVIAPMTDRIEHPLARNPFTRWIRYVYPMFLLGPFFRWIYPIGRMYFPVPFDGWLLRADIAIFGFNVAKELAHRWGDRYWLTEWMNFSYLSYYWVTLYLPMYLYFSKRHREFMYVMFNAGIVIYACFICQALFPAQGPVHYDPVATGYLEAGPVTWFAREFLIRADIPGGAMPSGHIAGTVAIFIYAWRYARKAFWATSPIVVSLCISTVYGRYHYAVDGIAGILTALIGVYVIGPWLYARLFPRLNQELEEPDNASTVMA
ncbi:MAG TPA: phosphatase PAP2 family protein [Spirochaetota bacterium]|mgnify:CR=1 FL=1|nr:phosphatase PAP2 family protein [Spirochaetota bacterium]HPC40280.1 phosphatase PAP2 family protein [Spirochaetota bacterium]HPL15323.1 phosphatase PAP2 family protein [Spirochaetota bacterium]HQF07245.1 phosphatase PAP2 family protein [Spirochaetota bacterium]HQH96146.1 phosphatase PAP2 family protein [Spirochaetota bacterium]